MIARDAIGLRGANRLHGSRRTARLMVVAALTVSVAGWFESALRQLIVNRAAKYIPTVSE